MVLNLFAKQIGSQQRGRALTGGRFCFGRGRLLVFVEYARTLWRPWKWWQGGMGPNLFAVHMGTQKRGVVVTGGRFVC